MTANQETSGNMKLILQQTASVSKELEALVKEHESILLDIKQPRDFEEEDVEFEVLLREKKEQVVNQELESLRRGMEQVEMMVMVAEYVSSLEAERGKLKAQVKQLCVENSWLRKSLLETQQLLQESEVNASKLAVEKEHLEFLQKAGSSTGRVKLLGHYDEEPKAEEVSDLSVSVQMTGPSSGGGTPDFSEMDCLGYDMPESISKLYQLALQYVNQGMYDVAVPLCRKAIHDLEQLAGRTNPDLAGLLNLLTVIYREQGRYREAIKVLREALGIREAVFGESHALVASTLNNMAVLYSKCGDYKTAEPFCQRALEIRQELLGPYHPDVAKQFCNLAILCSHLGRYEEVEHYNQRALEIFQLELDHNDPNITKTMNSLATCYLKQGNYKAAEAMFKKVLHSVQREETSNKPTSSSNSSSSRDKMGGGRLEAGGPASLVLGADVGGRWHKISQVHSPTVKETLHSLTDTYRSLERAEEAAKLEKRETPSSEVGQGMPGETFTDRSSEQVGNNGPHASPKRKPPSPHHFRQPRSMAPPLRLQGWLFKKSPPLTPSSESLRKMQHEHS